MLIIRPSKNAHWDTPFHPLSIYTDILVSLEYAVPQLSTNDTSGMSPNILASSKDMESWRIHPHSRLAASVPGRSSLEKSQPLTHSRSVHKSKWTVMLTPHVSTNRTTRAGLPMRGTGGCTPSVRGTSWWRTWSSGSWSPSRTLTILSTGQIIPWRPRREEFLMD